MKRRRGTVISCVRPREPAINGASRTCSGTKLALELCDNVSMLDIGTKTHRLACDNGDK